MTNDGSDRARVVRRRRVGQTVATAVCAAALLAACGGGSSTTNATVGSTTAPSSTTASTAAPTSTSSTSSSDGASQSGGTLSLGSGISITPAAGWTSRRQDANSVDLTSPDGNAFLFLTVGAANSSDVTAELQSDISNNAQNPNYTDAQLQGSPTTSSVGGNFDQVATVLYTATGTQSFNGGGPVYGLYLEALNSSTQNSVFGDFHSVSQAELTKYHDDLVTMLNSLG